MPKAKAKILLVEDEPALRSGIKLNLEDEGFQVGDFENADLAWTKLNKNRDAFHLAVLDISLPGETSGVDLCRRMRESGIEIPVIFLTARNRLQDKLSGFDVGADDYITKPFELEELLARVKAIANRTLGTSKQIRIGDWTVDLRGGTADDGRGSIHRFNEKEIGILKLLVTSRGKPVSRDLILDSVWGETEYPTNRTIDNYIVKFRKIFEKDAQNPKHIITRHGQGYELSNMGGTKQ